MHETTKVYSLSTDTHYNSWDDLVAAEANGYAVVIIVDRMTLADEDVRVQFPRTLGPFATKAEAKRVAATQRRRWKKRLAEQGDHPDRTRFSIYVEPLWKDDHP